MPSLIKKKIKTVTPKYKSKFEAYVAESLNLHDYYEKTKISFVEPLKNRTYTPDFDLKPKVYLECKGKLDKATRDKMLWIRDQHPELHFLLLFQNSSVRIRKNSPTTYAMWAEKNNFDWWDWRDGWPKKWNKYLKSVDPKPSTDQPS